VNEISGTTYTVSTVKNQELYETIIFEGTSRLKRGFHIGMRHYVYILQGAAALNPQYLQDLHESSINKAKHLSEDQWQMTSEAISQTRRAAFRDMTQNEV
jgi:hypothetical protein